MKKNALNTDKRKSIPLKKPVIYFGLVVWNILFIFDILYTGFLGSGAMLAFTLLFIALILILISSDFRKYIFKNGVELNSIKKTIYLMLLISGIFIFVLIILSYK